MTIALDQINLLSQDKFIETLGSIFEHSPWVAENAFTQKPFDSITDLHQKMSQVVIDSPDQRRLRLIQSHPELAGKEADQGSLTKDSKQEQSRAGLNQCNATELQQLRELNTRYSEKHGFPFVIAVTGLNKHDIIAAMQMRIQNTTSDEFETSITEICKIGKIRLDALISE